MNEGFADAVRRLRAAGVDNPRLDARVLWDCACARESDAQAVAAVYEDFVVRRCAREPVAYITGHKEFWGLDFAVGPGVLIPRPDTETVVEAVRTDIPDRSRALSILDLGTGSGCLMAALLTEYPHANGVALEASAAAQAIAAENFERLGLQSRVRLAEGNWADGLSGAFDVVVSNPPYIPTAEIATLEPDVAEFEPASALDGGADGLASYRALSPRLLQVLQPGGRVYFEVGLGQDADVAALLRTAGLIQPRALCDLAGIRRVVAAKRP